ncbi:acetyl-CoA synthetase-like protein [Trametes coccinea BRFM310]|uniref:Acetyl-CoA synthetase-like protein n=1 Tax=Trametes coccinea (strain BRFM310) TaxID=1353009 RepID=A0A1Y2IJS8_TRAC3|nr:acetyl-CoA synthetase-like protein [Trametes coccinea BRFM310]
MATASLDNHYLSLLTSRFREHADKPVFRPYIGRDDSWDTVTYRDVERRLTAAKSHWQRTLAPLNVEPHDIVGCWLTGRKLSDLINGIALSALGYTPQFFSSYFEDIALVAELLSQSRGKALIIDVSFADKVAVANALSVQHFVALDDAQLEQLTQDGERDGAAFAFGPDVSVRSDDIAALFHSSGTTGGRPKIIPNTFKMLRSTISRRFPAAGLTSSVDSGAQTTINTIGSLVHVATFHIFLGCICTGACMVQSSSMSISPKEFVGMTRACGLNRLAVYATFLSGLIKAAKEEDSVKQALQGLHGIFHTGVALPKADEEWAFTNDLKVANSYSTTETGPLLKIDPATRVLRPIDGASPVFLPYNASEDGSDGGLQLHELVVPSGADDCPPPEFCGADGYYHTNDLFERVGDSGWVYRGRAGDWIKVVSGFCDTKAMEDIVRKACTDIVHDVVVVGSGRAFPCLIVESAAGGLTDEERRAVADQVITRTTGLVQGLFPHERIQDPRRVLVVEKGSLPRTREKGNVRRPAAEQQFVPELDAIYAAA